MGIELRLQLQLGLPRARAGLTRSRYDALCVRRSPRAAGAPAGSRRSAPALAAPRIGTHRTSCGVAPDDDEEEEEAEEEEAEEMTATTIKIRSVPLPILI